ncbi:MAG: hypothetical protein ACSLE6_16345 [Mycobacterium sp.]
MGRQPESELAWDLVDENRDILNDHERHTVFVHLGVGDYQDVVRCVLGAMAREQTAMPAPTVSRLRTWIDLYDMGSEFGALLARIVDGSPTEGLSA